VVAHLKRKGFAVEILSGDRAPAVAHAARKLTIDAWHAAMTPADKIAHIAAFRSQGGKVLMVGDGLNDAASLADADASLSVASALSHTTRSQCRLRSLGSQAL
jgi:Cu2+-exporting ATPase